MEELTGFVKSSTLSFPPIPRSGGERSGTTERGRQRHLTSVLLSSVIFSPHVLRRGKHGTALFRHSSGRCESQELLYILEAREDIKTLTKTRNF